MDNDLRVINKSYDQDRIYWSLLIATASKDAWKHFFMLMDLDSTGPTSQVNQTHLLTQETYMSPLQAMLLNLTIYAYGSNQRFIWLTNP